MPSPRIGDADSPSSLPSSAFAARVLLLPKGNILSGDRSDENNIASGEIFEVLDLSDERERLRRIGATRRRNGRQRQISRVSEQAGTPTNRATVHPPTG